MRHDYGRSANQHATKCRRIAEPYQQYQHPRPASSDAPRLRLHALWTAGT